jgi:hypothetical protein
VSRADANAEGAPGAGARIGRKLGIGLFWLLAVYMVGMSAASIIPALYWPNIAPRPDAPALARCAAEIDALERELLRSATASLRRGQVAGVERSLLEWDQRAIALSGGCGALEPAREDLLKLRAGIGALLAGYRSGTLRVQQRLQRTLDAIGAGRRERPKT